MKHDGSIDATPMQVTRTYVVNRRMPGARLTPPQETGEWWEIARASSVYELLDTLLRIYAEADTSDAWTYEVRVELTTNVSLLHAWDAPTMIDIVSRMATGDGSTSARHTRRSRDM